MSVSRHRQETTPSYRTTQKPGGSTKQYASHTPPSEKTPTTKTTVPASTKQTTTQRETSTTIKPVTQRETSTVQTTPKTEPVPFCMYINNGLYNYEP